MLTIWAIADSLIGVRSHSYRKVQAIESLGLGPRSQAENVNPSGEKQWGMEGTDWKGLCNGQEERF